jgi:DNA-binding response OmpR family regulator
MSEESLNRPLIFLVEEDNDTRPLLKNNLTRYGYRVSLALDAEDAVQRLSGGRVVADLILIDLVGKPAGEVLRVGRRMREEAGYDGRTPLVVMAERYDADAEGTDAHVGGNDWITYLADHRQLKNLLARLISTT